MKHKMFLIVAAMVLLFLSAFNIKAQVGFNELDPNILWVADSTIGRIDGFDVHPNGNIFAYYGSKIYEIDGSNGKLIRELPKFSESLKYESIALSKNGRYLATCYDEVTLVDFQNNYSHLIIGNGNKVEFTHDSKKIAYVNSTQIQSLKDSIVVILDLETGERQYIKTEEIIQKIAFSPDGRFLATGGSGKDMFGKFYTSLKLWDANTLKLIKELEKFEDQNYQIPKIEFSNLSRKVAFYGGMGIIIFDTDNYNTVKHYTRSGIGLNISRFTFLSEELLGIQSEKTSIFRLSDDFRTDIYEFTIRAGFMETNSKSDVLFVGTGNPKSGGSIVAFDLNKVFSGVNNEHLNPEIKINYQKGRIQIQNLQLISPEIKIQIIDMNGKIIKNMNLPNAGSEISIPVRLTTGTYLLHVKDGSKEYSSKFFVTE